MAAVDALYKAARDVIGGALGGLMAVWVSSDMNQTAITLLALGVIVSYGALLVIFERIREKEQEMIGNQKRPPDREDDERPQYWPEQQAS